jgi:hypothetical protein
MISLLREFISTIVLTTRNAADYYWIYFTARLALLAWRAWNEEVRGLSLAVERSARESFAGLGDIWVVHNVSSVL